MAIWDELVDDHGFPGRYGTLARASPAARACSSFTLG
jgi:hypothetical protein